ncbi:MAG: flagellar biosynthesis protein FlhF [Lachnospiraceae bacterium]|nr:flagellar biosynthesis protein FlhF [Lachnospiraceae bacterium]
MIIKKFQAKTEAEAVENAKKELGENIVVMNVKNVKKKGLFAFLKPQMTEVTVALEEEQARMAAHKPSPATTPANTAKPVYKPAPAPAPAPSVITAEQAAIEEKLESLQSLLEKQIMTKDLPKEEEEKEAAPKAEVKEEAKEESEIDKFIKLLYNTMIDNEVDEKYANQILDEVEKLQKPNMPIDFVLAGVYQKMILKFGQTEEIKPSENGVKVLMFVGPTGVGKTTTIAKLAGKFCVEQKKKVALLTADTYRIAAVEQLRTYANILKVPFRIIYTVEEMETAISDFSEFDYILIDTAGHSHQNREQKENIGEFTEALKDKENKDIFLVLSATTKYKDLLQITDTYKDICNFKLIFTKLDETGEYGNLLNLKLYTGSPISYVTCGQNVPDDIEVFNPQKTVKQLLGGKQ